MGRKPRVDRSPEETWQIVQEGIKNGNVSETCRRHGMPPQGAKAALGGRSAAAAETEKDHRIRQLERTLGRKSLEITTRVTAATLSKALSPKSRRLKKRNTSTSLSCASCHELGRRFFASSGS